MRNVASRLEEYPEVERAANAMAPQIRRDVTRRIAREALARTGVDEPDGLKDLDAWADLLDDVGWTMDEMGEPAQPLADFRRARAAFAYRDACLYDIADSLYESIAALGSDAVEELLRVWA